MIRDSILYLLANLAARAASFVMIPFYSSFLSPAEYGTIELIELTTQVVSLVVGLGMFGGALIRLFQGVESPSEQNAVASTAVLSSLALNVFGVAAAVAAAGPLSRAFLPVAGAEHLLRLTFTAMLFSDMADLCLCYVRLKDRAVLAVAYSIASLCLTLALNVYFIAFRNLGVLGFVLSKLIVMGCGSILLTGSTLRETGLHFHRPSASALIRFGAPLIPANAAFFALHFGDRFFLSRFAGMSDVGNYSLAYKFGFLVTFLVAEPFGRAWNVRYVAMTRTPGWRQTFRSVSRLLAAALVAAGLAIAVFSDETLHFLVTPPYYPAFRAIPLIAAAYVFRELGDFFRNMLFINLKSPLVSIVSVAAAALNFLLNWLWIPSHGMLGAAWATLVTWALYALVLFLLAEHDLAVGFPAGAFAGFLAAGAAWLSFGSLLSSLSPVIQFAADTALCSSFYFFIWKSGLLSSAEKDMIRAKLQVISGALAERRASMHRS